MDRKHENAMVDAILLGSSERTTKECIVSYFIVMRGWYDGLVWC